MKHRRAMSYFFLFFFVTMSIFISETAGADPLDNWHLRTSPVSETLNSATYGNGMFVAVGDNGTILSSNDGVVWTSRISGTTVQLNGVTYGNGIFVAVGLPEIILTSSDGMNWTTRRTGTTYGLNAATYGNGMFVAVGSSETILTSSDALNWTLRHSGTGGFEGVTYGNGSYIALSSNFNTLYVSTDGIYWNKQNMNGYIPAAIFFGTAYGQGAFIIVGGVVQGFDYWEYAKVIFSSFDGLNWRTSSNSGYSGGLNSDMLHGATYGNNNFVAVGSNGTILSSSGGVHWTARASGTTQWLYGATYGNGTFVAVGDTILQSDPMAANTDCTASLSSDLSLHVPIIDVSGSSLWADFQYEAGGQATLC